METTLRDYEFVFVGGMHRSGTTYLADSIASGESATGLANSGAHMGEGQFLQDVFPLDNEIGRVTGWALDGRAHLTDGDIQSRDEIAGRLWRAWSPHWDLSKRYLVEKTPNNITKTTYSRPCFPTRASSSSRGIRSRRHSPFANSHMGEPRDSGHTSKRWSRTGWRRMPVCAKISRSFGACSWFVSRTWCCVQVRCASRWRTLDGHGTHRGGRRWIASPRSVMRESGALRRLQGGESARSCVYPKNRESTRERAKAYLQGVADALLLPKVARQITERYRSEISGYGYDLDNFYEAAPWR